MCRMFLYVSKQDYKIPKMRLKYILDEASHSIKKQAIEDPYIPGLDTTDKSIMARNPKYNLDGYGVLFKMNNSVYLVKSQNSILKNNDKVESKDALLKKIENLKSNFIMIFIRNNNHKKKYPNELNKVQPFLYENWYFMHNGGFTKHFNYMKNIMIKEIDKKYLDSVGSNLDSKILFSFILTKINKNILTFDFIKQLIIDMINYIYNIKPSKFNITLNFILSNVKKNVYIVMRYRTCKEIPAALYYKLDFKKGFIVCSEPINYQKGWTLLNDQLLIIINYEYKLYNLDNIKEICI